MKPTIILGESIGFLCIFVAIYHSYKDNSILFYGFILLGICASTGARIYTRWEEKQDK